MDKVKLKDIISQLINEASEIAPSIIRYNEKDNYGSVTDEGLDCDSLVSWDIEVLAVLNQLATTLSPEFAKLKDSYAKIEDDSKGWHSQSIAVHKKKQLLAGALKLLDSPLLSNLSSFSINKSPVDNKVVKGYAFIAMPMDSENHELVDVHDAVKAAAEKCDIKAERIDDPQSNERITDRIVESIQKAEYIFVDLTHSKPNVYFEAGYAHGIGKLPIYFAKEGIKVEFDLKDYPIIFYKNLKQLKESLINRLKG